MKPPTGKQTGKQTVLGTLGVLAVFAAIFAFGLSGDCSNQNRGRSQVRNGMTCLLGKRPVPSERIRAQLDVTAAFAKEKGYAHWPGMCAQFFRNAMNVSQVVSWDRDLGDTEQAAKGTDLDALAAAVAKLYSIEDWARP